MRPSAARRTSVRTLSYPGGRAGPGEARGRPSRAGRARRPGAPAVRSPSPQAQGGGGQPGPARAALTARRVGRRARRREAETRPGRREGTRASVLGLMRGHTDLGPSAARPPALRPSLFPLPSWTLRWLWHSALPVNADVTSGGRAPGLPEAVVCAWRGRTWRGPARPPGLCHGGGGRADACVLGHTGWGWGGARPGGHVAAACQRREPGPSTALTRGPCTGDAKAGGRLAWIEAACGRPGAQQTAI